MAVLHHAVILQGATGLPEDATVNNIYTEGAGAALAEAVLAQENLVGFFNDPTIEFPTTDLAGFISPGVSRAIADSEVRTWEINPGTGVETFVNSFPFTLDPAVDADGFPQEVAVVLSFNGLQDGSALDNNRRGRIFIGPLGLSAGDTNVFPVRPQAGGTGFVDFLVSNAQGLTSDMQTDALDWIVWSRTLLIRSIVDSGYVDNAFDTQRRRGVAPTVRTFFP